MNDDFPSEDLSQWPSDPFELLGVPRQADPNVLRRAYTRLIRRFKPEQYPEHFRRIREAYENARSNRFFFAEGPPADPPPHPENDGPVANSEPTTDRRPMPAEVDLDTLWRRACDGEVESAYRELRSLCERGERMDEAAPRLYWLLRVHPTLEEGRAPCDWLLRGLRQNSYGPCRELYFRELEERPAEVMSERFAALLDGPMPLFALADWIEQRWRVVGLGRQQIVVDDVARFRPRFMGADDTNWARLLLRAIDYVVWSDQKPKVEFVRDCCQELERMTHVHAYFDLSRLDMLLELARPVWVGAFDTVLHRIRDFIPRTWTRPVQELRGPLLDFFRELLADPVRGLEMLDAYQRSVPLALAQFAQTVDNLQFLPEFPRMETSEGLAYVVTAFLQQVYAGDYHAFRAEVFLFCLRESLLLHEFADAAAQTSEAARFQHALPAVREDWPLRTLLIANRYYWR